MWEGLDLPTKMGAAAGERKMDVGRNRWYIPPEQIQEKSSLSISLSTVGCFRLKSCFPLLVVELPWPVCDFLSDQGLAIGAVVRYLL